MDKSHDEELWDDAESRKRYGDAFPDEHIDIETVELAQPQPAYIHHTETLGERDLVTLDFSRRDNALLAKGARQWLADAGRTVDRQPLFGDFWNEGEISILLADSGTGKSLLAVQIAESIASGKKIPPFELKTKPQRVLLLDFEMDDKQFELRYRTETMIGRRYRHYEFSDNLIRAKMGTITQLPDDCRTMVDHIYSSVEELIRYTDARVVVIDNITWINPSTDNTSQAAAMMKNLKYLKTQLNISILVLAHTPKRYKFGALELKDLQGSKVLANFADNIFAMGKSRLNKSVRYLKHLKARNGSLKLDDRKVCSMRLKKLPGISPLKPWGLRAKYTEKPNNEHLLLDVVNVKTDTFLGFSFEGFATERDHITWHGGENSEDWKEKFEEARFLATSGHSIRQITEKTGIKQTTLHRHLKKHSTK